MEEVNRVLHHQVSSILSHITCSTHTHMSLQYVLLNVGEECITRFMVRDHNPSAINHVKHKLTIIKWFIVVP